MNKQPSESTGALIRYEDAAAWAEKEEKKQADVIKTQEIKDDANKVFTTQIQIVNHSSRVRAPKYKSEDEFSGPIKMSTRHTNLGEIMEVEMLQKALRDAEKITLNMETKRDQTIFSMIGLIKEWNTDGVKDVFKRHKISRQITINSVTEYFLQTKSPIADIWNCDRPKLLKGISTIFSHINRTMEPLGMLVKRNLGERRGKEYQYPGRFDELDAEILTKLVKSNLISINNKHYHNMQLKKKKENEADNSLDNSQTPEQHEAGEGELCDLPDFETENEMTSETAMFFKQALAGTEEGSIIKVKLASGDQITVRK